MYFCMLDCSWILMIPKNLGWSEGIYDIIIVQSLIARKKRIDIFEKPPFLTTTTTYEYHCIGLKPQLKQNRIFKFWRGCHYTLILFIFLSAILLRNCASALSLTGVEFHIWYAKFITVAKTLKWLMFLDQTFWSFPMESNIKISFPIAISNLPTLNSNIQINVTHICNQCIASHQNLMRAPTWLLIVVVKIYFS